LDTSSSGWDFLNEGVDMKKWYACATAMVMAVALLVLWGCEWEGSDDFNTSGGAGININFSGTYTITGVPGVTTLVLSQTGNTLQGRDNLGTSYSGSIGSPGVVSAPNATTGAYPAGATMLQTQINLTDGGTTTIVGNIRAVSVTDVRGSGWSNTTTSSVDITTGPVTIGSYTGATSSATYSVDASNTHYVLSGTWATATGSYGVTGDASAGAGVFTP
jgi:hypothetical protein